MYRKALALLINPHSVNLRQPKFILNGVKTLYDFARQPIFNLP